MPIFPTPLSFGAPLHTFPLEVGDADSREETTVMGLSSSEDGVIV